MLNKQNGQKWPKKWPGYFFTSSLLDDDKISTSIDVYTCFVEVCMCVRWCGAVPMHYNNNTARGA